MALSEDAIMGLNIIGAHLQPFTSQSLRSHRAVAGYEEYLNEGITDDPIPTKEGMQVILDRIAADAMAKRKRQALITVFKDRQASKSYNKHRKA